MKVIEIRKRIESFLCPLGSEKIATTRSLRRFIAGEVLATRRSPNTDEALRDGYVIGPFANTHFQKSQFTVVGEIAAGAAVEKEIVAGEAYKIYTGGVIPKGGWQVIAFENCRETEGTVYIPEELAGEGSLHINRAGSDIEVGEVLVSMGTRVQLEHLLRLVSTGVLEVEVFRQPRVACYCTGSELVVGGEAVTLGEKISLNGLLFETLLPQYGGVLEDLQLIKDQREELNKTFSLMRNRDCDLYITTGGMGPGKYDLVKESFERAGGTIFLESLPMRPGKSMLLGQLGRAIFVGLPGPPGAVRTLISELVGPILLKLQGAKDIWSSRLHARLEQHLQLRIGEVDRLKNGVLSYSEDGCTVRMAGPAEQSS